jgi:putative ABC transport system permease protein
VTLFQFAVRNVMRRRTRSALTVAAVALGIAAIVALTSIAWGFEASWQRANDARGTDLIVTRLASENSMPSPFAADAPARTLRAMPHVTEVVGLLSEMLSVGDGAPPLFVFGWAWDSYLWHHLRLVSGRWPASDGEPAVVLGSIAADVLHKRAGDRVELEGRAFTVAGVFESPAVIENGALIVTLSNAQQVVDKPGKVNVLNLKLDAAATEADVEAVKARVRETMPGFVAFTSGELVGRNAIVRIAKAMSGATVIIAGLVGALVVFNSMLMSVNERTREVGVLQALGWRRRTVMRLVVGEALILTLAGGLCGVALGMGAAIGLEHLDVMRGKFDAVFSPLFVPAVIALCALLGVAGGLVPAWKAARMLPAHALRHE